MAVPALPLADDAFGSVLSSVGVHELLRPSELFTDMQRVLAPGAPFVVSYANRCFPTKAVAICRSLNMRN